MYTTMLEQMIRELKGENVQPALDTALNLGLTSASPTNISAKKTSVCESTSASPPSKMKSS